MRTLQLSLPIFRSLINPSRLSGKQERFPRIIKLLGQNSVVLSLPVLKDACNADLQVTVESAAAVVGNLSTTDQFFSAIREAGAIQRLVKLLDHGPTSRTTEIAAKTLANLASESSNRKGIRLAGGVPPLMRLLMESPSQQVGLFIPLTALLLHSFCAFCM